MAADFAGTDRRRFDQTSGCGCNNPPNPGAIRDPSQQCANLIGAALA
jgi:hypothetical protein